MRIVYILTSLGMGGAERQALAVAERMARRGHAVAVLTLMARVEEEWATALEVHRLDVRKSAVSLAAGLVRARRFCRDFRPELIHSHCFHANIFARLLKVLWPHARVLSTLHNVYEGGGARMMAYRLTDGLAGRTTAVSRAAAERFVRLRAIASRRCSVVPNAIDTAEFMPDDSRRARTRAEMGTGEEFVWLAAGRVAPAKDYPNLLRAFARVQKTREEARLWVAGEGGGVNAAQLRALAQEVGLADSIRWLGLRRDMAALLDAADGFVLGSAWEGMPLALGEAMAMGKPVVATDVGGVRELVGETRTLVKARDHEALAGAMLSVMDWDEEARRQRGWRARRRIEERFSMDARADEWEALYGSLVGARA
ncbi:MAG TPA: glycosyltransferase [Terracidiphilus sp.]|nr:glycosyltransferase [Terracidiphilus sp.]